LAGNTHGDSDFSANTLRARKWPTANGVQYCGDVHTSNGEEWEAAYAQWAAVPAVTVQVIATNTAVQTIGVAAGTGSPTVADMSFNNTITSPTAGTFDHTTFTASAAGTYLITASSGTSTASAPNMQLVVNGTVVAFSSAASSGNLFAGSQGRGTLSMVVNLNAGDTVKIQGLCSNTGFGLTLTTDGTTRLAITKLS